ncbi:MAG: phenylalanine--tRNA ligase beta subunit-related protein, partial [Bacilli bacterium]
MRVKIDWLNELVDLVGLSTEEIVNTASLYSIEIENVDKMVKASNIVIGHVLTKVPHPNSDHLNLLTVDVKSEVLNIVCGAPNVDVDQYVIVALNGAKLLGGVITPSKIRGYESNGMVCSLQELGIENKYVPEKYAAGIYYFLDKVEVGIKGDVALQLDSPVLELGITPNRGDLLSMIGVAYEFSASFNRPLKPLVYKLERDIDEKAPKTEVSIETEKCITYYAQMVTDITIKPSPRWLKARLIAFGLRPINNCVDITNYILALYGQPLHAFDADVLGHKIVVKNS